MAREWFCEIMGQLFGPLEPAELRRMATAREITPTDKIRQGENGKWVEAAKVKGLFDGSSDAQSRDAAPAQEPPTRPAPRPRPAAPPSMIAFPPAPPVAEKQSTTPPPLTPEVVHATDGAAASWIGPTQPPLPQVVAQSMPVAAYAPVAMPVSAPPVAATAEPDYPCPFCGEAIKRQAKKCKHCGEFLDPTLRATTTVNVSNVVQVGRFRPQKSAALAALLAFLFGPLGMLYSTVGGAIALFIINVILVVPTLGVILLITWPVGIVWAAVAANRSSS